MSNMGALAISFAKMVTKSTFELFVNRKPVIFSSETRKGGADVFPDGLGGQPQPPPAAGYRIVHLAPSLV
ncbi:MAG: hypothetical protein KHW77_10070, partial [Adlercreutzia equolifaciens]|nr:hypothetical protein [Adlercreutzia equolifaciens]